MNVAFNTAANSMIAAQNRAHEAGAEMVRNAAQGQDIIQPAVAIIKAEKTHAASAAVMQTVSDMTDRLLDIKV